MIKTPTAHVPQTMVAAIATIPPFLGKSGGWWDAGLSASAAFAAIAALALFAFTAGSIEAHKREAINAKREADAAKADLETYKLDTAGKVADATLAGIAAGQAAGNAQTVADDAQVKLEQSEAKIAEADARAAEANLALANFKQPRVLTPSQLAHLISVMKPFAGLPFDVAIEPEPETIGLMEQIGSALRSAGLDWKPHQTRVPFDQPGYPSVGQVAFSGIAVQIDIAKTLEWGAAVGVLWHTLKDQGFQTSGLRVVDHTENSDAIHIYIGKKPL